jgi:pyruvate/2-oxoglutarate/acetoin dehydrogenase E1 component
MVFLEPMVPSTRGRPVQLRISAAWYAMVPGLKVVMPYFADAKA